MIDYKDVVTAGVLLEEIRVARIYVNDLTYNKNLELRLEGSSQEAGALIGEDHTNAIETIILGLLVKGVNDRVQQLHDMGVDAQKLRLPVPEGAWRL